MCVRCTRRSSLGQFGLWTCMPHMVFQAICKVDRGDVCHPSPHSSRQPAQQQQPHQAAAALRSSIASEEAAQHITANSLGFHQSCCSVSCSCQQSHCAASAPVAGSAHAEAPAAVCTSQCASQHMHQHARCRPPSSLMLLLRTISLTPFTMFLLLLLCSNVLLIPGSTSTCPRGVSGDWAWCGVAQ
jgi:hypothetical protein